MSDLYWQVC